MGVGKTTFARALLEGLGVVQPPEGSPSFAIAHEYLSAPHGSVVHVDFYRLRSETEIEEAGINAYFWERRAIVIAEWVSMFPGFEEAVLKDRSRGAWVVNLAFAREGTRTIMIEKLTPIS
jgi:tRNA threonylcarbamoyl adenosine modification protein YjeE